MRLVKTIKENWMSHVIVLVVSVSIFSEDKVLMIRESKPNAFDKWNFPRGRIDYGEDILNAARREVKEETGLDVKLNCTTGVYNFISSTNNQVILFHFTGEVIGGTLKLEEEVISEIKWVKTNELEEIRLEDLREPKVLKQIIGNLLKEKLYTISMFNEHLTS